MAAFLVNELYASNMVESPLQSSAAARPKLRAGHSLLVAAVHRPLVSADRQADSLAAGRELSLSQFSAACSPKRRPSASYQIPISRPLHLPHSRTR